jgi:hypothetical protein
LKVLREPAMERNEVRTPWLRRLPLLFIVAGLCISFWAAWRIHQAERRIEEAYDQIQPGMTVRELDILLHERLGVRLPPPPERRIEWHPGAPFPGQKSALRQYSFPPGFELTIAFDPPIVHGRDEARKARVKEKSLTRPTWKQRRQQLSRR